MKRLITPIVTLALAGAAFAGTSQGTHRYLIEEARGAAALRAPADVNGTREFERLEKLDIVIVDLTDDEAAALRHSRSVRRIELDRPVHMFGTAATTHTLSPNSRFGNVQNTPYGITLVRAPQVWPVSKGENVKVGVIDTGMDYNHPDLKDRYKGGHDFVNDDEDPMDENGHGTHVAGTLAASDNENGVVGVAPKADLYALRVLDENGSGNLSDIIKALNWAIDHKLNIVSMSLGSPDSSTIEEAAFRKVADAGILAIAASGNDYAEMNADGLSFPAGYSTVISVGAVDKNSKVAEFSQRGADLNVVAPGVAVMSSFPVGKAVITAVEVQSGPTYITSPMTGSPNTNVEGDFVFCGLGKPGDFPASVQGKIALIKRGELTFAEKSKNAKAAGAIAAIVYNKESGLFGGTLYASNSPTPQELAFAWIPTVSMSMEDGEELAAQNNKHIAVKFGLTDDFEELQGTSMSTPHVSGVAALLWSMVPNATASQIRDALLDSAHDVGDSGRDTVYGYGLVDAFAAANRLAPSRFTVAPRRRAIGH
jgi:subtilisin family serine protease